MRPYRIALVAAVALAAACGDTESPGGARLEASAEAPGYADDQRFEVDALVLESDTQGPMLCLGPVMTSDPPLCGSVEVVGWDWASVEGETVRGASTYGMFHVEGTYTDGRFTLVEPARPSEGPEAAPAPPSPHRDLPCPEPEGGWVTDPALISQERHGAAAQYVHTQPDGGGAAVSYALDPAFVEATEAFGPGDEVPVVPEPERTILVARFTGDLDRHERELRAIWGGPMCVIEVERSVAELSEIQTAVGRALGRELVSSSIDIEGSVEVHVIVDDGYQERFDDDYGEGVVRVVGVLQPVD